MPASTLLPHDDGVAGRQITSVSIFFRLKNLVDSGECIIFAAVFEAPSGGAANERKTEKI